MPQQHYPRRMTAGVARAVARGRVLAALARARDRLAGQIKAELDAAAFAGAPVHGAAGLTAACQALIGAAQRLAAHH